MRYALGAAGASTPKPIVAQSDTLAFPSWPPDLRSMIPIKKGMALFLDSPPYTQLIGEQGYFAGALVNGTRVWVKAPFSWKWVGTKVAPTSQKITQIEPELIHVSLPHEPGIPWWATILIGAGAVGLTAGLGYLSVKHMKAHRRRHARA